MLDAKLTLQEAAARLGLSPDRFRDLAKKRRLGLGRGKALHFALRDIAVLEEELRQQSWLAVVSPQNWERLLETDLTFTVFPFRRATSTGLMRPGNRIVFY